MTGDRHRPLHQALDVFVYAPIGFVFSLRELVPQLAEKGREQVKTAVAISQLAVDAATKALPHSRSNAPSTPNSVSTAPPTSTPFSTPFSTSNNVTRLAPPPGAADALAIPGYDALSASQVVPRLEGLSGPELEAVRVYEEAGRGRRTVLNRIAQLQAAS